MSAIVRPAGLRGKKAAVFHPHLLTLNLSDVINRARLPILPKNGFGHVRNIPPAGGWGMLGNNKAGNCVTAGACHETMLMAIATGRPVPRFDDATSFKNYSSMLVAEGGAPYNPNDPSTDTGLDVTLAAQYRQRTGIVDADGIIHKIDAFAKVNNVDELMIAVYCFGVCGLGLGLPDNAEDQFTEGHAWDDLSDVPSDGHYPPAMGVNSLGQIVCNTWNDIQGATLPYVDKYADEMVAYLSKEYMTAAGVSPELINWSVLEDYLAAL
jgi:hypothetical protein